jgi:hypothetical protein
MDSIPTPPHQSLPPEPDLPLATSPQDSPQIFPIAPFIRLTLLLLYVALMGPLPFLAQATQAPVSPSLLTVGIILGWMGLYGALAQRVVVDDQAIAVTYPGWTRGLFRGGWRLPWDQVQTLKPRSTGQGGLVYYFVGRPKRLPPADAGGGVFPTGGPCAALYRSRYPGREAPGPTLDVRHFADVYAIFADD